MKTDDELRNELMKNVARMLGIPMTIGTTPSTRIVPSTKTSLLRFLPARPSMPIVMAIGRR